MIYRYLLAALCACAPLSALAQMRVELSFDQETYLPQETMNAIVLVYNSSGQKLTLGRDNRWLSFMVETAEGKVVRQKGNPEVQGEFTLPNGARARKYVDLSKAFDFSKFGRYKVTCTARVPEWGQAFSNPKATIVGISTGVTLWERAFGLPSKQADGRPEVRKFQLVQANHVKELSLYVRIIDESGYTYSLFPLGALVGFSKPEPQMDRWSNLHVFYQDASHTFKYFQITPDGLMLARQTWEIAETRPGLTVNSEGHISVTGGVRRISASDLPPPELLSERPASSGPAPLEGETRSDAEKAVK